MVRSCRLLFPAVVGVGFLFVAPWQVEAQPGGGGGRGGSGGGRSGGSFAPSRSAGSSSIYRGGAGAGYGYNHSYYYNGNSYRHYPYLYPFFYPFGLGGAYDYSYAPSAFGYDVPGSYLYDSSPPPGYPTDGYAGPPQVLQFGDKGNQEAVIEVLLPKEDAQVWLEGTKTNSNGTRRSFMTPPLVPGAYTYHVTASWKQDGQEVRAERTISIVPGRTVVVDFNKASPKSRMPLVDD